MVAFTAEGISSEFLLQNSIRKWILLLSVEKHLEAKSSFKGFPICMGCFVGENPNRRELAQKEHHFG